MQTIYIIMQCHMAHVKTMGSVKTMEIGVEAVVVEPTVILHIAVGHTEFVPIWAKTEGPQKMATKRTQYHGQE